MPLRDPIKNVVYSAQASDIHTVIVNGKLVMRNRALLTVDEPSVNRRCKRLASGCGRRWDGVDWGKRRADELSLQSFPAGNAPDPRRIVAGVSFAGKLGLR